MMLVNTGAKVKALALFVGLLIASQVAIAEDGSVVCARRRDGR